MERPKNPPRGTYDLLPKVTNKESEMASSSQWAVVEEISKKILNYAGFQEIRTPIFEATEIFARSAGESSDIVNKEMYTFNDRSDRSITLRPEGTAGVVRAFLSNGLDRAPKPIKLWYYGPMFRYERSQTGRYRQFTQLGVEVFGSKSPKIEFEAIHLAWQIFSELKIPNLSLEINSVGDFASRGKYQEAMKDFLKSHEEAICADCKTRMESNPLRALDCKVPQDQELYQNSAPRIQDYLSQESKTHQQELIKLLEEFQISYNLNPMLVRGLDYYTETVFEIKTSDKTLGVQNTICAGGRYDGLVKQLGGPEMPGFGWALGMERLMLLVKDSVAEKSIEYFVVYEPERFSEAYKKVQELRAEGKTSSMDFDGKAMNKQIEMAKKTGVREIIDKF